MSTSPSVLTEVETGLNTVWANTFGVAWSALTGTVDPWTKANIVTDAQQSVTQALGPGADPSTIAAAISAQSDAVTGFLQSVNADPSQASITSGLSSAGAYWFGANGILNPANWGSTTILLVAAGVILIFAALGWGLHH